MLRSSSHVITFVHLFEAIFALQRSISMPSPALLSNLYLSQGVLQLVLGVSEIYSYQR